MLPHGVERDALRSLGERKYLGPIFRGQKSFGDNRELPHGDDQNDSGHNHNEHAMAQRPSQRNVVNLQHPVQESFQRHIDAPMFHFTRWTEEPAAQHGRERERNNSGNKNRSDDYDGELMQQASHDPAHEKYRQEHGGQRNRHGQNRESDFARAAQRRLPLRLRPSPCGGRCFPASRWRRPPRSPPKASSAIKDKLSTV